MEEVEGFKRLSMEQIKGGKEEFVAKLGSY
jgi:hypothetical protein